MMSFNHASHIHHKRMADGSESHIHCGPKKSIHTRTFLQPFRNKCKTKASWHSRGMLTEQNMQTNKDANRILRLTPWEYLLLIPHPCRYLKRTSTLKPSSPPPGGLWGCMSASTKPQHNKIHSRESRERTQRRNNTHTRSQTGRHEALLYRTLSKTHIYENFVSLELFVLLL